MTLTQIAFLMFAGTAAGGLTMTALIAGKMRIPGFMGPAHGLFGLASLAVLFVANLKGGEATPPIAWWALGVFFAGMTGGLILFRVLFKNKAPLPLALVHGSLGAIGLYLLYAPAWG